VFRVSQQPIQRPEDLFYWQLSIREVIRIGEIVMKIMTTEQRATKAS
jgi:hypothetical protein